MKLKDLENQKSFEFMGQKFQKISDSRIYSDLCCVLFNDEIHLYLDGECEVLPEMRIICVASLNNGQRFRFLHDDMVYTAWRIPGLGIFYTSDGVTLVKFFKLNKQVRIHQDA